ncbi:SusC/RagA family TonB-linked outer membrane protein [Sphingobacterium pedocola]|uniref:SusC/RagA family TonB-linked outer membrane protein n=1 Tax=Sphingobacterium pedocola TaxID=2082722 RepID=A0ABR9T9K9_9SPHI|nr:TonB-dependent receptor [Sphingobacterium pedocola]MBE8721990.1 SusC/RagA family TonB-linked outer membrane protein [Sphingobacterium pedocola]
MENKFFFKTLVPLLLLWMLFVSADSFAQALRITGNVSDSTRVLSSVTVGIKGAPTVTQTDVNGNYVIDVPSESSVLVYSIVGYLRQEVQVGEQLQINVTLQADSEDLDEIVVVGFGQQKRSDMVGSVTSVNVSELKKNPSSNLTTALAGRVAGMIAYQRSGEPGQDNADFFIRGVTTFGYKVDPLILIDNMEVTTTQLARLQPDDIASFSIMKDATATAVYGARGANGVILVTTKQGQIGNAQLYFRIENSISTPTRNVDLADPVTYMRKHNEAVYTRTPLGDINPNTLLYSDEKIMNTELGENPYAYPANDWREMMFKDYAMNQRMNLNVSGGGGVARYFVSGTLNRDNGVLKVDHRNNFNNNIDLKSYALRTNVNINLTKTTEMVVRLNGSFDDYRGPIYGGAAMYERVVRSNPVLFPAYFPEDDRTRHVKHIMYGNFDSGDYRNPYADMTRGYKDYSSSTMAAQVELKHDFSYLTEGLSIETMFNTNRYAYFDMLRSYEPFYYTLNGYDQFTDTYYTSHVNPATSTEYLSYEPGAKTVNSSFYLQSILNYNRRINEKHGVSGLLVFMMREYLDANADDLQLSLPFRNLGVSGRTTYSFDNRYFAEFNFGYNGSERFHQSKRYGFFPSAGLAWSVSNEKFFEPIKDVITNLRLRTTYGMVGNDAIGSPQDRFFYLSNIDMDNPARRAVFGRDRTFTRDGISIERYANQDITWETAVKQNYALELGLFNRVTLQAEYFSEYRKNILMTRNYVPVTMGLNAPIRANVGEASSRGTDVSVDYQQSWYNGWWLSARGNFTYATNRYENYEEPQYNEQYRYRKGNSIGQSYGYIAEKLFVDDYEAYNSPSQPFGEHRGGDIKYLDVNNDGRVTEDDMVPIGNPIVPEIVYGFGFSVGYKGLDASAFFQGLTNESFWIDPNLTHPFANHTQLLDAYADSHWSEDNQNVYALWPRLSTTIIPNNTQSSTWFMRDGTFLRLKQTEIGYSLPASIQKKLRTSNFRIFLSGSNLLTFSSFKLWDVEMGGNGLGYPIQRVFNVGVNINF